MLAAALTIPACRIEEPYRTDTEESGICVSFVCEGLDESKVLTPDENVINDINLYVFNAGGIEECHRYVNSSKCEVSLLAGSRYDFYAFANAGYDMGEMTGRKLEDISFYMTRPDGYAHGMPMACIMKNRKVEKGRSVEVQMKRLMSKLSVCIDRRNLDKDVEFYVNSMRVGNCPRIVRPFTKSSVLSRDELFPAGFFKYGAEISGLNKYTAAGKSAEVSVYLLENAQDSLDTDLCSFIELEIDYLSQECYSGKNGLRYRFYIREKDDYRIERNCHYHVTVCPYGNGLLEEDDWRVDKSDLVLREGEPYMKLLPAGTYVDDKFYACYYEMDAGDSLHITIDRHPKYMNVSLKEDFVADERDEGRALYTMDPDRKGFGVRSLGRSCTSMMVIQAGAPLNDEELIVVNIRQP